ncbi:MAG TPA: hypothetical protein VMW67_02460 [Desulfobacteria bacterium]|nr:hypothetical protein [Desulfobacteria bacterium]
MNDIFVLLQTHDGGDKLRSQDIKGLPEQWYFSLKPDYKQYLKDGIVQNQLRKAFDENKNRLSINAIITSKNEKHWEIINCGNKKKFKKFLIEDVGTHLNIYHQFILDYIALYYLLDLDDQWELELGSSVVVRDELENMGIRSALAREKKGSMLQTYGFLAEKIQPHNLLPVPKSLLKEVSQVLPERNDVEHVCQAVLGRWDYFITTDFKTILIHTEQLKPLGIIAVSPRDFVENNFMTLEQLVRTLHGSWTNLEDVAIDHG